MPSTINPRCISSEYRIRAWLRNALDTIRLFQKENEYRSRGLDAVRSTCSSCGTTKHLEWNDRMRSRTSDSAKRALRVRLTQTSLITCTPTTIEIRCNKLE